MVGKCFYHDTPPHGPHLFVVLAPSLETNGWFICVNITTKRERSDTTCEVFRGEHECLTEDVSVVMYAWAKEFPPALINRSAQGVPDIATPVLLKIQQASLVQTSRMKKGFQKAIRAYLDALA